VGGRVPFFNVVGGPATNANNKAKHKTKSQTRNNISKQLRWLGHFSFRVFAMFTTSERANTAFSMAAKVC
jgi:hypothetical protein